MFLSLLGLLAAGCGDDASRSAPTGDVTVLAAASLTDSFKEIGAAFEIAYPGSRVTFSFASSSALVIQINQGAPVDVFASADTANMDKLTASSGAGTASTPVTFATNKLQIIVGKGNPRNITGIADLAKPGLIYVTAAPEVPIGAYAKQVLDKANVTVTAKSLEADVKAVVNKVTLGEADAGIVYATDVKAAGDKAVGVAIPDDVNVVAKYPIAVIKASKKAAAATAFVGFVTDAQGQTILAKYGFTKP
ncbi:MAG TPA: molybdate ABC transporter substrate-binding protein [Acidimicrobiales bacterium]|nr:molybdate ABC transporter substrate-binding protein [Acidimicrobiales bacterium]